MDGNVKIPFGKQPQDVLSSFFYMIKIKHNLNPTFRLLVEVSCLEEPIRISSQYSLDWELLLLYNQVRISHLCYNLLTSVYYLGIEIQDGNRSIFQYDLYFERIAFKHVPN